MEQKIDYRDPKWVASKLGLDKNTVYRLLQDGTLPAVQIGRKWLISESRLAEYLQQEAQFQTTLRRMTAAPSADRAMEQARAEAADYRHAYVGQEHLLLALTVVDSPAKHALARLGADEAKVRSLFEGEVARGSKKARGKVELTPRLRKALCLAAAEAQQARRVAYGAEHLLIGLLRTREGMAVHMLASIGIDLGAVLAVVVPDQPDERQPGQQRGSDPAAGPSSQRDP
ncbi:MAG: helix-turn-helix domain-containing protein [Pirellulales bacterium]|nr:helix-turn-helix domain-containing protein [Pirellulales bacterium]